MDATVGQNGLLQAEKFMESVKLDGVVLTKLDGTARGGIAAAIGSRFEIPIVMVGVGEGPEDLVGSTPEFFPGSSDRSRSRREGNRRVGNSPNRG